MKLDDTDHEFVYDTLLSLIRFAVIVFLEMVIWNFVLVDLLAIPLISYWQMVLVDIFIKLLRRANIG